VTAKQKSLGYTLTPGDVRFDFNLGYLFTVFLALCFVFLGTVFLFNTGVPVSSSADGFATQLIAFFTGTIGQWAYPIIASAAIAVMFSTLLTLVDACPRGYATIIRRLRNRTDEGYEIDTNRLYSWLVITQVAGVAGIACGATHSLMERCNLACTSCYLTDLANRTEPLPFELVREQLQRLRAYLGPGGKAQITSGEVTLLPLEDLGRIVAYARAIGLDPMVMTNGVRFLREPEYLFALVRDFGLRKLSFHVDSTQRGLASWRPGMRERELHPLRDELAELVLEARRRTGARLHAAHTVTVTPDNLADVPDVVDWVLDRADPVRILSFQPVAPVGRTEDVSSDEITLDAMWELMCRPVGRKLNRHAMHFGHPECNVSVPLLVVRLGQRREVVELVRAGSASDERVFGTLLRVLAPAVNMNLRAGENAWPVVRTLLTRPRVAAQLAVHAVRRAWSERRVVLAAARALLGGELRIRPLVLVVHKFMGAAELETPLGRERLAACVFKLPVDGEMVSMCELNASPLRARLNLEQLRPAAQGRTRA